MFVCDSKQTMPSMPFKQLLKPNALTNQDKCRDLFML